MSFKKTIAALLCALFLVTAVVPALADERAIHQSTKTETITGLGVSAEYYANFIGKYATGEITLTFLPDPTNQLLEGSYYTRVVFELWDVDDNYTYYYPSTTGGMIYSKTIQTSSGKNVSYALYHFYVNGVNRENTYLG